MKRTRLALLLVFGMLAALLPMGALPAAAAGPPVFINEIHYDNAGTDAGEAVEIAGPAGTDLTGWSLVLYNGANGLSYTTTALSGIIPNQQAGYGTLFFPYPVNGLQNGSPDGLALVDTGSTVVQFLSYEGTFTALDGPANGILSTDIGVSEASGSAAGDSLQLGGSGTQGGDFTWAASQPNTFGGVNTGQTFGVVTGPTDPVINEFVADHTGADSHAFVEVFGDPSTDYSTFTVLEIEGDSTGAGVIDAVLPVGTTNAGGYWTDPEDMENGTITIMLVENFLGSVGTDLDTNDDGTLDSMPWTQIVDDVAVSDGNDASDQTYSSTVLAPFFDGAPFGAGGASRIPNGTDTDTTADWTRNDFDGFGLPGFAGSPLLGEAENTPGAINVAITVLTDPIGVCGDPATLIHDIQGSGLSSTDVGNIREIEGVVVGDFQGSAGLNGFNVQEEDGDADGDSLTSEGIFVFDPADAVPLDVGDVVRVRGSVAEFNGLTEISNVAAVIDCDATGTASASTVTLPVATVDDFEPTEGMSVTFPQALVIAEYFNFDRFGEIVLTSERHLTPTAEVEPGPAAIAGAQAFLLDRITLDDGRSSQNPDPAIHPNGGVFDLTNLFRGGDTVANVTGVMDYAFGLYRIQPTEGADYTNANPRPTSPDDVGGSLKVATFNVLNYFTTLDNGVDDICGPATNQECRGADNADEFTRQRDKIIAAMVAIDADVLGLMEIENHPADVPTADLVAGLNAAPALGTYDYIATGAIGTDAIRQAILYKPASVTPLGSFAILDSDVDPAFNDQRNRPMVVQTFVENATGAVFTVGVNHLKSKGSACNPDDPDTGDGSGNCNVTRTNAAQAIVDFMATDPTGSGDGDYLIIGDLNSYDKEGPIDVLLAAGLRDLVFDYQGEAAYSYVFDGQTGYLDYQLANASLSPQVTGATVWHINADEADLIDYDTSFKQDAQDAIYAPDAYRSSDHDPVVVGLALNTAMGQKESAQADLEALLPTGNKNDDKFVQKAIDRIDESLNPAWWIDSSTLDPKTGNFVFDREHQAVQELEKVATVDVSTAIDPILEADRQLALKQLIAAILGGGNASRIVQAQGNMADAAANVAAGDFANAVLDYKKAWTNAVKAQ
ncbi:MAG: ExeM/NucH family extracellular endonuclease [Acidimicrobiia bacterium]|nr:ExeM/NucH family extracellular endonuclease [Acidimicrobiia bacterium]MDH3397500.1 ExeM/NucH family extracellular endonuclease [Acidimicrobiia bacterium]